MSRSVPNPQTGPTQSSSGQFHPAQPRQRAQRRFPVGREIGGMNPWDGLPAQPFAPTFQGA
ncbi:MAG: hypothetical protein ABR987_01540 [Terracidiphilus sp.]